MKKKLLLFVLAVVVLVSAATIGGYSQSAYALVPYNASNVLGQSNFTTSTSSSTQSGQNFPAGNAIDNVQNRLFVADYANNRVLVYDSTTISNGQAASYVLGQPDFATTTAGTTQSKLSLPGHLYYDVDSDRLFVTDIGNNRVVIYNTSNITNGMNAANVLGQANFTSSTAAITQNGMNGPGGISYDTTYGRLFVADTNAHRVLVYNTSNITNGMNAANVLGQANFTNSVDAVTQSGMRLPNGIAYDSADNRLFVADFNAHRVTVFDITTITNGMNAANVFGQPDFISSTPATTQNGMRSPIGLAYDDETNRLFASEFNNMRVLIFNVAIMTNGMNAVGVLGQPSFTTNTCGLTASGMCGANGLTYDVVNNRLIEADLYQSRTLIFNFAQLVSSLSSGQVGQAYQTTTLGTQTQGTTTYVLTSGVLPPGLSLDTSTGQLAGTPTAPGSYSFSVSLSDDNGVAGIYTDTASYTLNIATAQAALPGLPQAGNLPTKPSSFPFLPFLIALVLAGGGLAISNLITQRE